MPAFRWCLSPLPFSRDLSHLYAFLTHLCVFYLVPFICFLSTERSVASFSRVQPAALCLCPENERCIRWLFLCYSYPCAIIVLRAHRETSRFHLLCCINLLYNFLSGVRRGMAVSTITAVKAGLLLFSGPETARYARWCNTYKGVFKPFNIDMLEASNTRREHPRAPPFVSHPNISAWMSL